MGDPSFPYQSDQEILQSDDSLRCKTVHIPRNSQSNKMDPTLHVTTPKNDRNSRRHSFDETFSSPSMLNMSKLELQAKDTPETTTPNSMRDKGSKRGSKGRHNSFDDSHANETPKSEPYFSSVLRNSDRKRSSKGGFNSLDETPVSVTACATEKYSIESSPSQGYARSRTASFHEEADNNDVSTETDNYLCRKFFFMDSCPHVSSKKGSGCTCLYEHYPKNSTQKSLAQVLQADIKVMQNEDASMIIKRTLETSSKASAVALSELDDLIYDPDYDTGDGHIDMLYYMNIPFRSIMFGMKHAHTVSTPHNMKCSLDSVTLESKRVSRALLQVLAQEKCPIGSIVYLAIGTTLIFDRYNGGIVTSWPITSPLTNSSSVALMPSLVYRIPDSILEYIVMFLPNNASGILPLVCKLWYNEIGTNSPALWKSLIERNNWPTLDCCGTNGNKEDEAIISGSDSRILYRNLFISHYSIIKNLTNLFTEIKKSGAPSSHPIQRLHQKSCLTSSYTDRNETCSSCVEVLPFTDSSVLVAYRNCTLRLFDVVVTPLGQVLKQSLSVRMAPFGISRKTSIALRAAAIDNHTLLCSYSVHNAKRIDDPSSNCWLASIRREDLLCMNSGSTQDELSEVIHVFNIYQRISDYLPKIMDHAPDNFADFLISGGSTSDLHVKIGQDLVSCGNGRFIFLAHILDGPHDDENTTKIATVTLLFSTSGASIMWMEFLPPTLQPELSDYFTLCSSCGINSKPNVTIAVASSHGSHILLIEVDARKAIVLREISDDSHTQRNPDIVWDELDIALSKRCGIVLAHEIIIADKTLLENTWQLTFLSYSDRTDTSMSTLMVHDCISIRRIQHVGDHVIAEVNFVRMPHDPHGSFGFIIVHIPSRLEVHRYCLEDFDPVEYSTRHRSLFTQNLLAFILVTSTGADETQVNVILSSSSIRNIDKLQEAEIDPTKKKPKKTSQKSAKKDGYARGMTLHG